jgi:hypothetical protein
MNSIIFKNLLNIDETESLINDYDKSYKVDKGYFGLANLLNLPSTKKYHIKFKKIIEDVDGGLIYESNKIPHSRPALESEYMYNLFLHYIPTSTKKII